MLQTYNSQSEDFYERGGQGLVLSDYLAILKRRALYFVIPFGLILILGSFVTAIQRPIYEAKGKILVESQEIPVDLVKPTVTQGANERIQVMQQRIMTRDNLLALVTKYGMFSKQRLWMSGTELFEAMRQRTKFDLVDISSQGRAGISTIAFTVSFEYENPEITLKVTNDLLTLILDEDARNRTTRAAETTKFLTLESQRLQGELAATEAQIVEKRKTPRDDALERDPAKMQVAELTRLKEELAQKSSMYSAEYPAIKALKKKIAAMEQLVAQTPSQAATQANSELIDLARRGAAIEASLISTNKKLEDARLGEKLERSQQSERLQVLEQPILPQKPTKPNRTKLFALSFALAMIAGAGAIFAAETLDRRIRHGHQLVGVANGRAIVSIPYIATRAETFRRKSRLILLTGVVGVLLLVGLAGALFFGPSIDLSWVNQFWLDKLTALSK